MEKYHLTADFKQTIVSTFNSVYLFLELLPAPRGDLYSPTAKQPSAAPVRQASKNKAFLEPKFHSQRISSYLKLK